MTMVGRTYRWDGRVWRVITRWRDGGFPPDQRAFGCDGCGLLLTPGYTFVGGCDCGMGWACYLGDGLTAYRDYVGGGGDERNSWHVPDGQLQWWRERTRAPRNVLLERLDDLLLTPTGEFTVRPFRGLRRVTP